MTQLLIPRYPYLKGQPVIICTGCVEPIPAPRSGIDQVQCRNCGKRITVVNIEPAGESSRAT